MTSSTAKAPVELLPGSPTTKSLCPAGAGLIDQGEATKGAHTPPQACAALAIDRATATTPATPHAQLAKGYKHPLPATTGHTTAEEDAMTTTKETKAAKATIKDLQNLIRTQHEYTEGLAGLLRQIRTEGLTDSLTQQIDQILQKHTPCSTCGGSAPNCPDCDGASTQQETLLPIRHPGTEQRARELMAANPRLSAKKAAMQAKREITEAGIRNGGAAQ
jgi:hypothetical protein